MPDVIALVMRHAGLAGDPHADLEDLIDRHPRLHGGDGGPLAVADRVVVAPLLVGRRAQHRGARDVRAIALIDTPEVEAHEVALRERPVRCVHVGERRPVAHRDHGEEGLGALSQDLLLERQRPLALGDAGLEHAQHGRDPVLRDERGPLETTHLLGALHHARGPEVRIGGLKRRPREAFRQPLPRGRKHARLVHADPPAQRAEIAQHLHQRVRRARRGADVISRTRVPTGPGVSV